MATFQSEQTNPYAIEFLGHSLLFIRKEGGDALFNENSTVKSEAYPYYLEGRQE